MLDQHPLTLPVPYEDGETMDAFDELPHQGEGAMDEKAGAEAIDIQIADAMFTA